MEIWEIVHRKKTSFMTCIIRKIAHRVEFSIFLFRAVDYAETADKVG